ncbi:tetratricopeptide repeat protein [Hydrogenimonas sp.]|jgi:predicted Zn-dependent protease|uniref:tetratricopeptide repeat protein n=1 Tax=Hydrogenimonas sp. TaxID=2231112 RepID=UPI002626D803|nr:tetratricopeptide repeat protein [Hydrogenimonas sp.]
MSRYLSAFLTLFLLLTGCSQKSPHPGIAPEAKYKAFDYEYDYIIHALYYKEHGDYGRAYIMFDELYRKTGNPEYKIESIKLLIAGKRYEDALKQLTALIEKYPDNVTLYRLMTVAQLRLNRAEEALASAKKVVELEPENVQNIDLLASIYLIKGMNQKAYDVYESYYSTHHDDTTVVKMASILYHQYKKPQDAIRLLETHSKMIGCTENVCLFLAELYRQNNDLENLADVYARMYDATKSSEYAQKAAEIYAYKKEFDKAEKLLIESKADDKLLLAIYKHTKAYEKAAKLAKDLYDQTLDPLWLAEYGVLLYEAAPKKDDPKLLKKVIRLLSEAFKEGVDDPLYYNYLGYLLIDHDIDVKWGVDLVKKALRAEPDSAFYIDSLAWGHYKLGECQKAYNEMKKVIDKLGLKDEEIKAHWKKIEKCRSRKK